MHLSRRSLLALAAAAGQAQSANKPLVIDAHCHAGRGQEMSAPWSTRADPEITWRHMAEAGIDPGRRAETLAIEEFADLANAYKDGESPPPP